MSHETNAATEQSEPELPDNPKENPADTVDALEKKVARDSSGNLNDDQEQRQLPGSDGTEPPA